MVHIDGSYGEGGGQIVRTACSLAAVSEEPCHIFNVRSARRVPGLRLQHLQGIRALAELCDGRLEGDEVGSREVIFHPRKIVPRKLSIKLETAASTTLLMQTLLPAALAASAPIGIELQGGGTDVAFAPTLDHFQYVFLWFLSLMGADLDLTVHRRSFYPKGGAQLTMQLRPGRLKCITLTERGALKRISLISRAASILKPRRVAERQIEAASAMLNSQSVPLETTIDYFPTLSAGTSLCILAEFEHTVLGVDGLGARGKLAEAVGRETATAIRRELESPGCVDRHMGDEILPYLALARGGCVMVSEITSHCRTNMWVIEKFLEGRFEVCGGRIRWEH
jgi:RNA 3'-phosphate cyclase